MENSGRNTLRRRRKKYSLLRSILKNKKIILMAAVIAVIAVAVIIIMSTKTEKLKGADYSAGVGYEGLRVKRVIEALDMGETTGMGGACLTEEMCEKIAAFQTENNIEPTGEVDLKTWKALGFTEEEWDRCGSYQSPDETKAGMSSSEKIEIMINRAYEYLGDPYVIGASGPPGKDYGLDCSGLVMQALYAAGFAMSDINPVTHASPGHEYESRNMWSSDYFERVGYEDRQRGDLVFYAGSDGVVYHVAIYLGDDQVIESWPNEVQVSPLTDERHPKILGIKRVFQ